MALSRRGRLLGLLCQFPQSFHDGCESRAWLGQLAAELADHSLAVEFRHHSWFRADVPDLLQKHHSTWSRWTCPTARPLSAGLVQSGSRVYVRFHSRNAANWYRSDKDRYDYDYRDEEMSEWIEALTAAAPRTDRALLLFNNCHRAQAVENARRMGELIGRMADPLPVVGPFADDAPGARQRLLFD